MPVVLWPRIILEALGDLVYFPLWWYSAGVKYTGLKIWAFIIFGNSNLAPGIWIKNLFVPMYGQHDIQGRIISFFLRLVQIIARGAALIAWVVIAAILFLIWLMLPAAAVYGLIVSFF